MATDPYSDHIRKEHAYAIGAQLLERYLATLSLRQTAKQVLLHHTTVQYRLQRIDRRIGVDLRDPRARLRTQIASLLYRIERASTGPGS